MTDVELTRALERGEIANEGFHHLSHLHVAWVYLMESLCVEEAAATMRNTLQRFAASAGKAEKYHETITSFWVVFWAKFICWALARRSSKSCSRIRNCSKRIFRSLITRRSGSLARRLERAGVSRT